MKLGIKFCITIAAIITAMVVPCIVVTKKTTVSSESESISETGTMSCIESESESETETKSETITESTKSSVKQILYTDGKGNSYEILKEYTANDGRELILFQNIKTKTVSLALRKYFYENYHLVED